MVLSPSSPSQFGGIDDSETAAELLNPRGEIGCAAGPISSRLLVPVQQRVKVLRVIRFDSSRVDHPKIVACERRGAFWAGLESVDLFKGHHGLALTQREKSLFPITPGQPNRLLQKRGFGQRQE